MLPKDLLSVKKILTNYMHLSNYRSDRDIVDCAFLYQSQCVILSDWCWGPGVVVTQTVICMHKLFSLNVF